MRYGFRTESESLQVGGWHGWHFEALRECPSAKWNIRKYKEGKWEQLVDPTLAIAEWVTDRELTKQDVIELDEAIYWFERTRALALP